MNQRPWVLSVHENKPDNITSLYLKEDYVPKKYIGLLPHCALSLSAHCSEDNLNTSALWS